MARDYDYYNHTSGKVVTFNDEEKDVVSSRGAIITESETAIGEPFALYMGRVLDPDLAIIVNTSLFDTTIQVNCPNVAPTTADRVCLKEGTRFYQGKILSVIDNGSNNYTLGLDTPLDFAFTTNGGCSLVNTELNVNGSVAPVVFAVSPIQLDVGTEWDVHGFTIHIVDESAMDDSTFGGIAALTKGLVIRLVDGITKSFANIKVNGDFGDYSFSVDYVEKAPSGAYAIRANLDLISQYGTTLKVRSDEIQEDSDRFEAVVQDNLTGLTSMHILIHGHIRKA